MGENSTTKVIVEKGMSSTGGMIALGALAVGASLAAYFLVAKPILQKIGVIDSAEEKRDKKLTKKLLKLKGFNPNYYKEHLGQVSISRQKALQIAFKLSGKSLELQINEAKPPSGFWDPLPFIENVISTMTNNVTSAFRETGSNVNLSLVADTYEKKYGKSLVSQIKDTDVPAATAAVYKITQGWRN